VDQSRVLQSAEQRKLIGWDTTGDGRSEQSEGRERAGDGYIQGANFGKAIQDHRVVPEPISGTNGGRLFRMAFGIRF